MQSWRLALPLLSVLALLLALTPGGGQALESSLAADGGTDAGAWTETGSLGTARREHAAVRLPSGEVLVCGGVGPLGELLDSAEVYAPASGTWRATRPMPLKLRGHSALLLPSGQVLVAGGAHTGEVGNDTSMLYEPASGTWRLTGSASQVSLLIPGRYQHSAVLLHSGEVMVAGGNNAGGLSIVSSVNLYDPVAEVWRTTAALPRARSEHTAVVLPSGKVLVAGGGVDTVLTLALLYDRGTERWTSAGELPQARSGAASVVLPSGQVLVVGGVDGQGSPLLTVDAYEPATSRWSQHSRMTHPQLSPSAVVLPSGRVLVTGRGKLASSPSQAEVYDPGTGRWSTAGLQVLPSASTTPLLSGQMLVAGGRIDNTYFPYAMQATAAAWLSPREERGAPVAHSLRRTTPEDTAVTVLPPAPDAEALGYTVVSAPEHGAVSGLPRALIYTPHPDFHGGDTFVYTVSDGERTSSPASVQLTVQSLNDAPTAQSLEVGTSEGRPVPVRLVGQDIDGDALRYEVLSEPEYGTLSGTPPDLRYTPPVAGFGRASFTYQVRDETSVSEPATVSLTVEPGGARQGCAAAGAGGAALGAVGWWLLRRRRRWRGLPGVLAVVAGAGGGEALAQASRPEWVPTGSLAFARSGPVVAVLSPGAVLLAGGYGATGTALDSAELYDVEAGTWRLTGRMRWPRADFAGAVLSTGEVVLAGAGLVRQEIYFPRTGHWGQTSDWDMNVARFAPTLGVLSLDRLLVAGGTDGSGQPLASAELFSGSPETWRVTGPMAAARARHAAVVLSSGRVLVAGGWGASSSRLRTAELYEGATGTWSPTGPLLGSRSDPAAVVLSSGRVLVAGGLGAASEALDTAELYDEATGTWSATGRMARARSGHTMAVLPSGRVLVAGGLGAASEPLDSAEVYDPATGTWSAAGRMGQARTGHAMAVLSWGAVLVAGGQGPQGALVSAELHVREAVNRPPEARSLSARTPEATPVRVVLEAWDVNGDTPGYEVVTGPTHGTLSGGPPELTYTPAGHFHGEDRFTYQVSDGAGGTDVATVTLTVTPVNDAPQAEPLEVHTSQGQGVKVLLRGTDVDEDVLTYTVVEGPRHGELLGSAPALTYAPRSGYGRDSFTYRVSDGVFTTEPVTVSILVARDPSQEGCAAAGQGSGAVGLVLVGLWLLRARQEGERS